MGNETVFGEGCQVGGSAGAGAVPFKTDWLNTFFLPGLSGLRSLNLLSSAARPSLRTIKECV